MREICTGEKKLALVYTHTHKNPLSILEMRCFKVQ